MQRWAPACPAGTPATLTPSFLPPNTPSSSQTRGPSSGARVRFRHRMLPPGQLPPARPALPPLRLLRLRFVHSRHTPRRGPRWRGGCQRSSGAAQASFDSKSLAWCAAASTTACSEYCRLAHWAHLRVQPHFDCLLLRRPSKPLQAYRTSPAGDPLPDEEQLEGSWASSRPSISAEDDEEASAPPPSSPVSGLGRQRYRGDSCVSCAGMPPGLNPLAAVEVSRLCPSGSPRLALAAAACQPPPPSLPQDPPLPGTLATHPLCAPTRLPLLSA